MPRFLFGERPYKVPPITILPSAVLFGYLLALTGCGNAPQAMANYPIISDSAGVRIVDNGPINRQTCTVSPDPILSIGVVEGEDAYQFFRVFGAAKLSNGNIAVVNQGSQELRVFDPQGRFLYAGGTNGEGPGEFSNAFHLRVLPEDSIWVGDLRPWEFELFDGQGTWIRNIRPSPEERNTPDGWGILDDGSFIMGDQSEWDREAQWETRTRQLNLYDKNGTRSDSLTTLIDGRWGLLSSEVNFWAAPLFESFAEFDARGSTMVSGNGSATEFAIWDLHSRGARTDHVRWSESDREVKPNDIEREHESIVERNGSLPPELYKALVESQIGPDRPIADVIPAFTEIHIGLDGSFWLKSHSARSAKGTQDWKRFDESGLYSCTATLPDKLNVYEFGSDYILARDRDDEVVERVVEYGMEL